MGQARHGMGEGGKALQMIERALDIDPTHVDAARFLVEIADGPARKVEARVRLLGVLEAELQNFDARDDRREAREKELLDQRLDIVNTLADELNRPVEAVVQMQAVLERRPDDIPLLHRALDLYSNADQWAEAVGVLDRLAKLQDEGPIQAKYRYAAASLMRAHNLDVTGVVVRARLLGVLEADPLHEKAFAAVRESLAQAGEWKELSKVLRGRLKATPEDRVEARVELLDSIANIYDAYLDDKRTALIAYEQAIALAESLGGEPNPRQAERRNKIIALSVRLGDDALDKGIEQVQAIINDNPLDYDSYHRLVELYLAAKQRDAAIVVSRTLRFLKQADEAEVELAAEGGDNYQPPRGTISRKQWRDVLLPNHPSSRLSDLYGLLWPVMAAREGLTYASAGPRPKRPRGRHDAVQRPRALDRLFLAGHRHAAARLLRAQGRARRLQGHRVRRSQGRLPDAARRRRCAGSAAGSCDRVPGWAGDRTRASTSDRIGAAALGLELARRDLRGSRAHAPAGRDPQGATRQRSCVGRADQEDAPALAARRSSQVRRQGDREGRRRYQGVVARLRSRGGAARVLVCDNIDIAARVILQGGSTGTADGRDLIKGLIAFSVTSPYIELRRSLKLGK